MAGLCLLVFTAGLLLGIEGLPAVTTEGSSGALFVSQQEANAVLIRQRRYNSGKLEEVLYKDNLERECMEEKCTMEEAREVFENTEKTMEFWANYIDGNQCQPPPCQNGGVCKDGINSYTCWCKSNFGGKNCETELSKQCSENNGGCAHFCVMKGALPVCKCAYGYTLAADRRSCESSDPFSCGHVGPAGSALAPRSFGPSNSTEPFNYTDTLLDDDISDYLSSLYEDYDLHGNDSQPSNISEVFKRSVRSDPGPHMDLVQGNVSGGGGSGVIQKPSWAFPTIPSIPEEENTDTRIVGGDEAKAGDIPWQITLMYQSPSQARASPFCGGSLLSELWVITAAHCLVQAEMAKRVFFVRVGEHDVNIDEVEERNHEVAEQHVHPRYHFQKSPYNHDIALLKLATPVELSVHRRPICLGPKDFTETLLRETKFSMVSGWGRMTSGGLEATKLQKLQVPYVDRTACKQSSRDHVTRFMFCAGYHSALKDACQGDSGGPHSTNYKGTWFLTGIVSWGEECAKDGKYGIYTRVSQYYRWISNVTSIHIN